MSGKSLDETTQQPEGNDFGSSSNKRMKEMSIDRLSALPDGILIHILSFLGLKKSAVTSVLSKRWKSIWTELPALTFEERSSESEKRLKFVEMVNRILLIWTGIHLEKFDVSFRYDDSFAPDIDSWVDFVLTHTVKEVVLGLRAHDPFDDDQVDLYSIPEAMYNNPSLIRFKMGDCCLDTLTNIEWPSLTHLDIGSSELTQHVVENILSGCPALQTLVLQECWGFSSLEVKSRNLHELKIHDQDEENGPLLEISAPYVHTLEITFNPADQRKLVLRNTESVIKAEIDFTEFWDPDTVEVASLTKELYEIVLQLKEVVLGRQYFKVLSQLVANGWQLPVSRLKSLTVYTHSGDEHNISGIFALLKFLPNLEKLAIVGFEHEWETLGEAAPGDLNCDLLHLKTVRISGFADPAFDGEPMLTLARTLLKRAKILENMTIKLRLEEIHDYFKIGETLLSYPRSSKKAVVRFQY